VKLKSGPHIALRKLQMPLTSRTKEAHILDLIDWANAAESEEQKKEYLARAERIEKLFARLNKPSESEVTL